MSDEEHELGPQVNLRLPPDLRVIVERLRKQGSRRVPRERYLRAIVRRHIECAGGDPGFDAWAYVQNAEDPVARARRLRMGERLQAGRDGVPLADLFDELLINAMESVTKTDGAGSPPKSLVQHDEPAVEP